MAVTVDIMQGIILFEEWGHIVTILPAHLNSDEEVIQAGVFLACVMPVVEVYLSILEYMWLPNPIREMAGTWPPR
jgi:hypothetical protein